MSKEKKKSTKHKSVKIRIEPIEIIFADELIIFR